MAKRLTKLQVDEVSVVDKGANNKRFLILKQATGDEGPQGSKSIRKTGWPSLFGRGKKRMAGTPGPTDGGIDMTPEDVKKAVTDAADEVLSPLAERIAALEAMVAKAESEEEPELEATQGETVLDAETITKLVAETATAAVAPLAERLEVIESAAGMRRSGLEEQGAHTVHKADGSFSWEGSGLLI